MKFESCLNSIVCGDCLEVMKDWPDNCVDLVLTDIPFNTNWGYDIYQDNLTDDEYYNRCCIWFAAVRRVAKRVISKIPTKHSYIVLPAFAESCGYKWTIIQSSPNTTSHGAFNLHLYTQYLVSKGTGRVPNIDLFINTNNSILKAHPAEMPIRPMRILTGWFTNDTDLVLDPFCGSGTTCVAAKMLGRRFIGIDISEKYCEIARQRLEAVDTGVPVREQRIGQMPLFGTEKI